MRGFISYSHDDKAICKAVQRPLKAISRAFNIDDFWIDDCTPTGRCFRKGYKAAIENSNIFILLISTNSIFSDEIMNNELKIIHDERQKRDCLVIPVIIDDCLWECVIGSLLATPRDEFNNLKPIMRWKPQRDGVNSVGKQMMKSVSDFLGQPPNQLFDWT